MTRTPLYPFVQTSCELPDGTVKSRLEPFRLKLPSFCGFTKVQMFVFSVGAVKSSEIGPPGVAARLV
jgi:hypothetical protein